VFFPPKLSVRFTKPVLVILLGLHRPRERLRSIVMNMYVCGSVGLSVCMSVCPTGYFRNHKRDLYKFLCMLPMSVARSSSDMFTIGRIAIAGKGFSSPFKMHYRSGKGVGVHSAGKVCYLRLPCSLWGISKNFVTYREYNVFSTTSAFRLRTSTALHKPGIARVQAIADISRSRALS